MITDSNNRVWMDIKVAPLLRPQSSYPLGNTVWVGTGLWLDNEGRDPAQAVAIAYHNAYKSGGKR